MTYFVNPRRYSVSCSNPAGGRCLLHPEGQQGPRRVIEGEFFRRYSYLEEVPAEEAEAKIESGEWHLEWSHSAYLVKNRDAILAMMPGGARGALDAVADQVDAAKARVVAAQSALEEAEEAAFEAGESFAGAADAVAEQEASENDMDEEDFTALKQAASAARVDEIEKSRLAAQASEDLESAKAGLSSLMDSLSPDDEPKKKKKKGKKPEGSSEPPAGDPSSESPPPNEGDDTPAESEAAEPGGDSPDDRGEEEDVLEFEGKQFSQDDIRSLSGVGGRKVLVALAAAAGVPAKGKNAALAEVIIAAAFSE